MAKTETSTADKKPRKPARTIEQQIADLKAKDEARQARRAGTARKRYDTVHDKIIKAEARLGVLYDRRDAAIKDLGFDPKAAKG